MVLIAVMLAVIASRRPRPSHLLGARTHPANRAVPKADHCPEALPGLPSAPRRVTRRTGKSPAAEARGGRSMSEQWPHFGSGDSEAGPNEAGSSSANGAEPDAAQGDLVTAIEEARAA